MIKFLGLKIQSRDPFLACWDTAVIIGVISQAYNTIIRPTDKSILAVGISVTIAIHPAAGGARDTAISVRPKTGQRWDATVHTCLWIRGPSGSVCATRGRKAAKAIVADTVQGAGAIARGAWPFRRASCNNSRSCSFFVKQVTFKLIRPMSTKIAAHSS